MTRDEMSGDEITHDEITGNKITGDEITRSPTEQPGLFRFFERYFTKKISCESVSKSTKIITLSMF
jgi:hypothetical protein